MLEILGKSSLGQYGFSAILALAVGFVVVIGIILIAFVPPAEETQITNTTNTSLTNLIFAIAVDINRGYINTTAEVFIICKEVREDLALHIIHKHMRPTSLLCANHHL